ncbi:FISUMP domain-containing protein [Sporocytophaga myxococcoides]|nr:FISUMP domain-containing protein [Sporocytophaga myxococcoides]
MKKLMLSWTLVLAVAGLSLMSCGKDKDDNKPEDPAESTFKDPRDNKVYKTIRIGNQTWFAENLNYDLPSNIGSSACASDSCDKYGKMYPADAALLACPKGWHLPSDAEWKLLEHNLGMTDADTAKSGSESRGVAEGVLKKMTIGGTSKFDIVLNADKIAEYWTSTKLNGSQYSRFFSGNSKNIYRELQGPGAYKSVRCLKD